MVRKYVRFYSFALFSVVRKTMYQLGEMICQKAIGLAKSGKEGKKGPRWILPSSSAGQGSPQSICEAKKIKIKNQDEWLKW